MWRGKHILHDLSINKPFWKANEQLKKKKKKGKAKI
jgi:hypothetical protein